MLVKIRQFLEGKKAYIIAIVGGVLSVYQALIGVDPIMFPPIPEWTWTLLAALGLGAMRASIKPKPDPGIK